MSERGPYVYRSIWLAYTGDGAHSLTVPQRVARNIPEHEIAGWEFVAMANAENGLFRRRRDHE